MKKISVFLLIIILCSISLLMNRVNDSGNFTTFEQQNIEALSDGESPGETGKSTICYTDLEFDEDDSRLSVTVFCGDCTEMPYTIRDNQLTCHLIEQ